MPTLPKPKPHTVELPILLGRRVVPGQPDTWRVFTNGKPSCLIIRKGPRPRYRFPQLWEVVDTRHPDLVILTAEGPRHALDAVRKLIQGALKPIIGTVVKGRASGPE